MTAERGPRIVIGRLEVDRDAARVVGGNGVVVARIRIPLRDRAVRNAHDLDRIAFRKRGLEHVLVCILRVHRELLRKVDIVRRPAVRADQVVAVLQSPFPRCRDRDILVRHRERHGLRVRTAVDKQQPVHAFPRPEFLSFGRFVRRDRHTVAREVSASARPVFDRNGMLRGH